MIKIRQNQTTECTLIYIIWSLLFFNEPQERSKIKLLHIYIYGHLKNKFLFCLSRLEWKSYFFWLVYTWQTFSSRKKWHLYFTLKTNFYFVFLGWSENLNFFDLYTLDKHSEVERNGTYISSICFSWIIFSSTLPVFRTSKMCLRIWKSFGDR